MCSLLSIDHFPFPSRSHVNPLVYVGCNKHSSIRTLRLTDASVRDQHGESVAKGNSTFQSQWNRNS